MRSFTIKHERWPLIKPFVIARGARTETETVSVCISDSQVEGRGECVPTARYGETVASVISQIRALGPLIKQGLDRKSLQSTLPAGAARNALDAALWDIEAKLSGKTVGDISGLGWPQHVTTVQTISIGSPAEMAQAAFELKDYPVLKVKLDGDNIIERIRTVRAYAPNPILLVDANESWTIDQLSNVAPVLADCGVVMIEQPLRAGDDRPLADYHGPLPIYADESCHTVEDLPRLGSMYQGINIKLDKSGGLTQAIALMKRAQVRNMSVMIGCMVSTSLGVAPALFLASHAAFVDVDAPTLIAKDRDHALRIDKGRMENLDHRLWGG